MLSTNIHGFVFLLYGTAMILIGMLAWRRTHSLGDYLLGGRRLGPWVTALSAEASDMSGWLLLGLPGYAYLAGVEAVWLAVGLLIGTYLNWKLVAARLREATERADNALTLPDFFARRFGGDPSQRLRTLSALFILLFFTFYASAGLVAGGKLFETVFGWDYRWAVLAGTLMILVYTLLGGFLAVAWTDLIQGSLMGLALLIVPGVAVHQQGGWSAVLQRVQDSNPALLDAVTNNQGEPLTMIAIVSLLAWGLGYFGQPHILARFMAIRSSRELTPARRIAVVWVTLTLCGALAVGLAGITALPAPLHGADSETVFMHLVTQLFDPWLAGALLAAILAAIMSTADSQLLVAASALSEDFYKALWRPYASDRELMWIGRGAVLLISLIAGWLALTPDNKVLDLVAYAWAGFGAAFGPTLLFTLYWSRMTRSAALTGIVTGGLTVVLWKQFAPIADLYEIVPGILCSVIAILLTAQFTSSGAVSQERA